MRVLGISPAHDASVCVINNGKLEYFFKEERLSRVKRDGHPYLALIEVSKLVDKIDFCVFSSPTEGKWDDILLFVKKLFNCPIEIFCDRHHLCHAALSFENSNYKEALVFVVDRNGSVVDNVMRESESIFHATQYPYKFKEIYKNYWDFGEGGTEKSIKNLKRKNINCEYFCESKFNITKVYETATSLIKQDVLENGKTMGLSSYGKDAGRSDFFLENGFPNDDLFSHKKVNYSDTIVNFFM